MLDASSLTLKHPAVQAAKVRWDARLTKPDACKHTITFEELFEYFKCDDTRIAEIAKKVGLSSERVRQIYNDYFRALFGGKSGAERFEMSKRKTHLALAKQEIVKELEKNESLKAIVTSARNAGCVVEGVILDASQVVSSRRLNINGHLCSTHKLRHTFRAARGKRGYAKITLMLTAIEKIEAVIFSVKEEGGKLVVIVVPKKVLQRQFFVTPDVKQISAYIPLSPHTPHKGQTARLDWWTYKDAWHLLPQK